MNKNPTYFLTSAKGRAWQKLVSEYPPKASIIHSADQDGITFSTSQRQTSPWENWHSCSASLASGSAGRAACCIKLMMQAPLRVKYGHLLVSIPIVSTDPPFHQGEGPAFGKSGDPKELDTDSTPIIQARNPEPLNRPSSRQDLARLAEPNFSKR